MFAVDAAVERNRVAVSVVRVPAAAVDDVILCSVYSDYSDHSAYSGIESSGSRTDR